MKELFELGLVAFALSVLAIEAALLVRDKLAGTVHAYPAGWSAQQHRYVRDLRIAGGVGLLIVWVGVVAVGARTSQPWQLGTITHLAFWPVVYTALWVELMRIRDWTKLRGTLAAQAVHLGAPFFVSVGFLWMFAAA